MDKENEYIKELKAARGRWLADRRHAAEEIARDNRRGLNADSCNELILVQTAIEALDKAIADEVQIAREQSKGVS